MLKLTVKVGIYIMEELGKLLALLTLHRQNAHILHWKTSGSNFHGNHKFLQKVYEQLHDDVDLVAEICMQNNVNPLSYQDILDILTEDGAEHALVDGSDFYSDKRTYELLKNICEDIIETIEALLGNNETLLRGQISDLENMEAFYSLISRYKIRNILEETEPEVLGGASETPEIPEEEPQTDEPEQAEKEDNADEESSEDFI